ncbi:MAG: hypothetical protein HKN72_03455 [Gemmatimonadetes bacterium]|nr:hypothetical protein [Gemmatimonadota bacterium]NNF12252.1 hypothetical protein [Gemmatimonadota bacterium]NNL29956.1 hypothetical protein [Gemmatimonadota bacterium]
MRTCPDESDLRELRVRGTRGHGRTAAAAVLAFVALSAGCTTGSGGREVSFRGANAPGLTITIRNQRTQDARFWIWVDGRRDRLGTVQSTQSRTFRVRLDRVAEVSLEFDLTLGERCVTRTASLEPGARLNVAIPVNLGLMDVRCGR